MQTVQLPKCRHCGAPQPEGAESCPACGAKIAQSSAAGKPGGAKLRSVPKQALDPQALLAKIDALDWDPTTTLDTPPPVPTAPQANWRLLLLPILAGLVILLVGAVLLLIWSSRDETPVARQPAVVEAPPPPTQTPVAQPAAVSETPPQQVAEAEREAERARVLQAAEEAAKRRAEKKRKAAAEQQALLEEQERLRRAEEERLRAEREAAEARARAVVPAAPPRPTSVRELCAKEDGPFARNGCEARACSLPEWRASDYCRQRWQEQMRTLNTP